MCRVAEMALVDQLVIHDTEGFYFCPICNAGCLSLATYINYDLDIVLVLYLHLFPERICVRTMGAR